MKTLRILLTWMVIGFLIGMAIIVLPGCKGCKLLSPEKEPIYIPLNPGQIEISLRSDPISWADIRFTKARYLAVEVCNNTGQCIPLPYVTLSGQQATYVLDKSLNVLTIQGHHKATAFATKAVVEFVL